MYSVCYNPSWPLLLHAILKLWIVKTSAVLEPKETARILKLFLPNFSEAIEVTIAEAEQVELIFLLHV